VRSCAGSRLLTSTADLNLCLYRLVMLQSVSWIIVVKLPASVSHSGRASCFKTITFRYVTQLRAIISRMKEMWCAESILNAFWNAVEASKGRERKA
jgi:hypothetical protein